MRIHDLKGLKQTDQLRRTPKSARQTYRRVDLIDSKASVHAGTWYDRRANLHTMRKAKDPTGQQTYPSHRLRRLRADLRRIIRVVDLSCLLSIRHSVPDPKRTDN